jgi:hypothetical protein
VWPQFYDEIPTLRKNKSGAMKSYINGHFNTGKYGRNIYLNVGFSS